MRVTSLVAAHPYLFSGLALLCFLAVYSVGQYLRTTRLIAVGEALAAAARPYEQHIDSARRHVLVLGDSSAVGTGADEPSHSVAGYLGADFPTVDIENGAINGLRTAGLLEELAKFKGRHFDLVLIHIGGNDTVRFVPLDQVEANLRQAMVLASALAPEVVMLNGGDVGSSQLFPWPLRWILTLRTKAIRDIYLNLLAERAVADSSKGLGQTATGQVHYVDIFRKGTEDPFRRDPKLFYAADSFHPSGSGYQDWYEQIRAQVDLKAILE